MGVIATFVKSKEEELKKMSLAELTRFGMEHFKTRQAFSAYKRALKSIGIDYETLRRSTIETRRKENEQKATVAITLYSDASADYNRFCIWSGELREAVWFGNFYNPPYEQSAAELDAAEKAVWFASKVKEALKLPAIKLVLKVDAQWLCWANGIERGGKARVLGKAADKLGVALEVEHIAGAENPADTLTRKPKAGYMRWQDGIEKIVAALSAAANKNVGE